MNAIIELSRKLTADSIVQLATGKAIAIRVAGFLPPQTCDVITTLVLASELHGAYDNAPRIHRVGCAFFEAGASTTAAIAYLENATHWIETMRAECAPHALPMDVLRLHLDEIWPGSAQLTRMCGRQMFAGLIRRFRPGAGADPHQDHLEWDAQTAGIDDCPYFDAQLAANIYMKVPPHGGELVIWPGSLNRTEYEAARIPGSYGVRKELLAGAPAVLTPRTGELIMFSSRNTHEVQPSQGDDRVASSNFLGYSGLYRPLSLWSY